MNSVLVSSLHSTAVVGKPFIRILETAWGKRTAKELRHPDRREVVQVPMYEYKCLDCGKEALLTLSLKEHDSGSVTCPSCKSKRMEQLFTSVMAKTSRKS